MAHGDRRRDQHDSGLWRCGRRRPGTRTVTESGLGPSPTALARGSAALVQVRSMAAALQLVAPAEPAVTKLAKNPSLSLH